MKITFLTHSVDQIGGTIRATLNTASILTDLGHEVDIVNVFKYRDAPQFTADPRVTMRSLIDKTAPRSLTSKVAGIPDRFRMRMSSRFYPSGDTRAKRFNRLTDKRVQEFLRDCEADVIVGTRPGLNIYLARFSPPKAVTVAQEHLFYDHHKQPLRDAMARDFGQLDAVVTVSQADADNYRRHMPHLADKVWFIPNSIQPTPIPPSDVDSKIIVAAGRIERPKRFDMLLRVFSKVHKRHPDWRLRIYGSGKRINEIRDVVTDLDLGDSVSLMGRATPLDTEWAKGSIAAVTSKYESFGLTLVEAMNCGLPVVSTACDYGPPEIIDHEVDGLLTPVKDENAVAEALCRLIEDERLRKRMSSNAIRKARKYHPDDIGARYEQLFDSLVSQKDRTPPHGARIPVGAGVGGYGLPDKPASSTYELADHSVDCLVKSFEDMTLTAELGFSGRYTLESSEHPPIEVPLGAELRLDPPFLSRLPEGRWRLFRDGDLVEAGHIDSRALLHRPSVLPGSVVVPYSSRGQLALRVWRRETYAELNSVRWHDGHLLLHGDVLGPLWGDTPIHIRGRLRETEGPAQRWAADIDASGAFFARLDVDRLTDIRVDRKDLWDLWLADDNGEHAPVRLARFFDDIAKRKKTQAFSRKTVTDDNGRHHIQPYYNTHNELTLKVTEDG
ncbi:glycosyltransferase family 4 protein [Stackebrandtia nassauensis]|uniref:Glycosyl transferase group 1 n=1 Tax=Stackebrandtia nassauensis (strain DSM 44728 / CIP 108903 / NRRL B-16338 / NBRC 102104 / LLR-40K-21) TaxID=446470 RepID=D3QA05_STANL|nr:glycosyltransferase family 4 protein [Stackebrandtia nassauensis]ADD40717.1 glycosyl transferase group 1 [Stackebrandtia nassauensis DSM 44728]